MSTYEIADWARRREFNRTLHAAPTTALERYTSLCVNRDLPPDDLLDLTMMTEALKLTLTFKTWEHFVDSDLQAMSDITNLKSAHILRGEAYVETVNDMSSEVWAAMVETELPMLWLDVVLDEGPVPQAKLPNLMLDCAFLFTYNWSGSIVKLNRLSSMSRMFTEKFLSKFNEVLAVSWACRERIPPSSSHILEAITRDLARIHVAHGLSKRQLADSRLAHISLWAIPQMDRDTMLLSLSSSPGGAFKFVHNAVQTVLDQSGTLQWLVDLIHATGSAGGIMKALHNVISGAKLVNEDLALCTGMLAILTDVPLCRDALNESSLEYYQQGSVALARQLNRGGAFEVQWHTYTRIWADVVETSLKPHYRIVSVPLEHIADVARIFFAMQSTGLKLVVRILANKARLVPDPRLTLGGVSSAIATHAKDFCSLIQLADGNLREAFELTTGNVAAFRREYTAVAKDEWFHDAKELRELQSKYGSEAAYAHAIRAWSIVGLYMGLTNAATYLRADQMCWNSSCQHHLTPRPTRKSLKYVCKGCKMAYYCSRGCQSSDWKERHRVQCRRLEAATDEH